MKQPRRKVSKSWHAFHIHKEVWEYRLNDLREFLRISEAGLTSKFKDWGNWYEERTKGFSEERKGEFIDNFYDDLALVRDTVPNLFRHAAFVMIVGFFEGSVADICRLINRTKKVSPEQKLPPMLYLRDSSKYLIKAGLPESLFGRRLGWEYCKRAVCLRNAVIHNNGQIPAHADDNFAVAIKAARTFVKRNAHISLSKHEHGDVMIKPGFCEYVLARHEKVFRRLIGTVEKKFSSHSCD